MERVIAQRAAVLWQFEREVTGERIRDQVAAFAKKGMWMGGWTALGYEVPGPQAHFINNER